MKQIDKLLFGLILGSSFPILFFLITLTLWFCWFQEVYVLYFVLPGIITGIVIDLILLKKLISLIFSLPVVILIGFYLFCNMVIYGVFMGFPVFNLVMGIIAGYYYSIKINREAYDSNQINLLKKRVPLFTGLIMLMICISTAALALHEKSIGEELQNMFGLGFQITFGMVLLIILIGGASLIVIQYFLTRLVMNKMIEAASDK